MGPELDGLANELATDGYHAWNRLYTVISGMREVTWKEPLQDNRLTVKTWIDLTRPDFWKTAINGVLIEVDKLD